MNLYSVAGNEPSINGLIALKKPVLTITILANYLAASYDRRFSNIFGSKVSVFEYMAGTFLRIFFITIN